MCHLARLAAFVLASTFSFHASGCESASAPGHAKSTSAATLPAAQVSQQLIVKFKPESIACSAPGIARFAKSTGVKLQWLRQMSGDACVVIQRAATPDELMKAQEGLKKHPEVEWMEIDAVMQRH